jgi:hypothetical protein
MLSGPGIALPNPITLAFTRFGKRLSALTEPDEYRYFCFYPIDPSLDITRQ